MENQTIVTFEVDGGILQVVIEPPEQPEDIYAEMKEQSSNEGD